MTGLCITGKWWLSRCEIVRPKVWLRRHVKKNSRHPREGDWQKRRRALWQLLCSVKSLAGLRRQIVALELVGKCPLFHAMLLPNLNGPIRLLPSIQLLLLESWVCLLLQLPSKYLNGNKYNDGENVFVHMTMLQYHQHHTGWFFLMVPPRKVLSMELVPPNSKKMKSSSKLEISLLKKWKSKSKPVRLKFVC